MRALYTAASGMTANQFNLDIIANNLANINTHGFKRNTAHFSDLLYQNLRLPGQQLAGGSTLPTGTQVGLGVGTGSTSQIFTQGAVQTTGNETDLAISGDGFFKVITPNGAAYTRDGSFGIDPTGKIVTADGYPIEPEIIVPPDKESISITADGTVAVKRTGQVTPETIGNIKLTRFINPAGLISLGGNLFQQSAASGDPIDETPGQNGAGTLIQKALEMPNVEIVEEMVKMITAQRAYETNSKAIVASDEMLQQANNVKR
jgi:flagellar basal-body rod protein FlgG